MQKNTNEYLDKETQKIMSEGEKWKSFVEGEMWKTCKQKMMENVLAVDSLSTIKLGTDEKIKIEIKGRILAKKMVLEWISEIEGLAGQYEVNKLLQPKEETYITQY